jgi:hypothetical protein
MDSELLKKEFEYYIANQQELVQEYVGKFIVIKNQKVIGVYDTQIEAYETTKKDHELGTFLIQCVEAGKENYTQTFYSRVLS